MDEKSLGTGGSDAALPLDGPHGERRRRAHQVLNAQDAFLERLESDLAQQLQSLVDEVAESVRRADVAASPGGDSDALVALQGQFDALRGQFAAADAEAARLRHDVEQLQVERAKLEHELRVRETLLKESQGADEQRRVELATLREQLADAQAQLNAARARQTALDQELSAQRERFEEREEETKAQRRRIARELKQQRAELEAREAQLKSPGANRDLEAALAEARAELEQAETEHRRQLEELRHAAPSAGDSEEIKRIEQERDKLAQRLAAAEAKLAERPKGAELDPQKKDDLQRRFEMAVEEVRELKRTNAELENKLKSRGGSSAPGSSIGGGGGGLNWEAQKEKLLASLEAADDDEELSEEDRVSIEGTIRITDQIVAQKDQEIAELRRQLEERGGAGFDSAAISDLLDKDELVRSEREKLSAMQAEWREKIGEAEIDISVERAKLARERAELDEKLRQIQSEQDNQPQQGDAPADPGGKPARGRWLARLGLKDLEEK